MAGTARLATAEELTKLTRKPLETLCARFTVDHGLSGKPKSTLVQRLVALKQVSVAHVSEVNSAVPVGRQASASSPSAAPRKQSSTQAATDTKRKKLEEYISRVKERSELRCEDCDYPLVHIFSYENGRNHTQNAGQRAWMGREPRVSCNRRSSLSKSGECASVGDSARLSRGPRACLLAPGHSLDRSVAFGGVTSPACGHAQCAFPLNRRSFGCNKASTLSDVSIRLGRLLTPRIWLEVD